MNDLNLNYARFKPALLIVVVTLAAVFGLFAGAQTVHADGSGNVDTVIGAGCMLDVYNAFGQGGGLNCTANDVSLATATNITILDDGCAFPGDTVEFTADFEVVVTAGSRNDVGIYISLDGDPISQCQASNGNWTGALCADSGDCNTGETCESDGALTGACTVSTPAYAPSPPWLDLDGTNDDTTNSNDFGYCSTDSGTSIAVRTTDPKGPVPCDGGSPAAGDAQCVTALGAGATCEEFGDGLGVTGDPVQDTCGDISKPDFNPLFPTLTQTVTCVDDDGDGKLDLPYCTSWRQSGADELCTTPLAAYPGTPSKCNCDPGFSIDISVPGQISGVDKVTLDFNGNALPGDSTVFDFSLTNTTTPGDADLPDNFTLTDAQDPYATPGLDAGIYNLSEAPEAGWQLDSAICTSDQGNPDQDLVASGGNVTVASGESLFCTFTNKQDGTVSGHVFEDTNGNGTQDAGEPNLAGVDVVITDSQGGTQTVTTDGNGDYTATVPPGATTADVDESTLPASYVQTAGTDPTTVTAVAGQDTDIGDDGYQPPEGEVTGRVYEDTNGNGIQDTGETGLIDVSVVITDSAGNVQTVVTDASGNYSATVPAGDTDIDIDDDTLPVGSTQTEGTDPTTVTVPSGGTASDIDGYQPPEGEVTGRVYEDTNGNGIQDTGETGLIDVSVVITDSAGNVQTVVTDASGNYSATVPAGDTDIDIDDDTLPVGSTQTEGTDPTIVTVPSGGTASDIDGYQPPEGEVTGRVYEDTNGNGIQDTGETGLIDVSVVITDSAGNVQTVVTDASGNYSATVPAGDTDIDIDDDTLPVGSTQTEGTDPTIVTVPSGGTASDIDGYAPPADFGDAPDTVGGTAVGDYRTTAADGGPSHVIVDGLFLGTVAPDPDPGTLQDDFATADDNDAIDDEDGILVPAVAQTSETVDMSVEATNNSTDTDASLVCYIDFNGDGDFLDAGEKSATVGVLANSGTATYTVSFADFADPTTGTSYIRCRIAYVAGEAETPVGAAQSGEVTDAQVDITDTILSVSLSYFLAERDGEMVSFEWETATESANAGFELLSMVDGETVVVTEQMVPSQVIDSVTPTRYTYEASVGDDLFYIELVGLNGERSRFGPFALGEAHGTPSGSDNPTQGEMTEAIFIPFIAAR